MAENLNPGSLVAVLHTVDEDRRQNYSYSVAPDTVFSTVGDRLETRVRFNYEGQNVYHVNITTTDSGNHSLTQGVVVSILNVNDAPTGIVLPQGTAIAENTKVSVSAVISQQVLCMLTNQCDGKIIGGQERMI